MSMFLTHPSLSMLCMYMNTSMDVHVQVVACFPDDVHLLNPAVHVNVCIYDGLVCRVIVRCVAHSCTLMMVCGGINHQLSCVAGD